MQVQARCLGEGQRLAQRLQLGRDDGVADQLHAGARPVATHVVDRLAHRLQDRPGRGEGGVVTTDDDPEPAAGGLVTRAEDRGVQERDAALREALGLLVGELGADRGQVDDGRRRLDVLRAPRRGRARPSRTALSSARQYMTKSRPLTASSTESARCTPASDVGAARGAVPHRHLMAGLDQVLHHPGTHGAEPQISDGRHVSSSPAGPRGRPASTPGSAGRRSRPDPAVPCSAPPSTRHARASTAATGVLFRRPSRAAVIPAARGAPHLPPAARRGRAPARRGPSCPPPALAPRRGMLARCPARQTARPPGARPVARPPCASEQRARRPAWPSSTGWPCRRRPAPASPTGPRRRHGHLGQRLGARPGTERHRHAQVAVAERLVEVAQLVRVLVEPASVRGSAALQLSRRHALQTSRKNGDEAGASSSSRRSSSSRSMRQRRAGHLQAGGVLADVAR